MVEENKELSRRVRFLEEIAAGVEATQLYEAAEVRSDGSRLIAHVFSDKSPDNLKKLAHALTAKAQTIVLLGAFDKENARLLFARSSDARGDMNELMREACSIVDGRGGGKPDMAQGGGKNVTRLPEAIEKSRELLDVKV